MNGAADTVLVISLEFAHIADLAILGFARMFAQEGNFFRKSQVSPASSATMPLAFYCGSPLAHELGMDPTDGGNREKQRLRDLGRSQIKLVAKPDALNPDFAFEL